MAQGATKFNYWSYFVKAEKNINILTYKTARKEHKIKYCLFRATVTIILYSG